MSCSREPYGEMQSCNSFINHSNWWHLELISYPAQFCFFLSLCFLGAMSEMQPWYSSTFQLSVWGGSIDNYVKRLNRPIEHAAGAREERAEKDVLSLLNLTSVINTATLPIQSSMKRLQFSLVYTHLQKGHSIKALPVPFVQSTAYTTNVDWIKEYKKACSRREHFSFRCTNAPTDKRELDPPPTFPVTAHCHSLGNTTLHFVHLG